jgi:NitT/TauT family transport system ATP-binding protein
VRWGQAGVSPEALKIAQDVFRPDLYDAALGITGSVPTDVPDAVGAFAGPPFDPSNIAAHLAAFEIAHMKS